MSAGPTCSRRPRRSPGRWRASARTLWNSLQQFKPYPDWLQIWPGHGAGSSCGKGISAVPHSTLGYERRFNWAFKAKTENDFVANVLAGQPDPPPYFAMMKRLNKEGPADRVSESPRSRWIMDEAARRRRSSSGARDRYAARRRVREGSRARHAQHSAQRIVRDVGRMADSVRPRFLRDHRSRIS